MSNIEIWEDCYLGYVYTPNISNKVDYQAIGLVIHEVREYDFYPWLSHTENITLPKMGLHEICIKGFNELFMQMANKAICYGSDKKLEKFELQRILDAFLKGFANPRYYSNFIGNGWRPVTNHTQDYFLCVIDKNTIGMWLSCNDE